jgi:SDR family mycofactocin-dependent oxidoreductase
MDTKKKVALITGAARGQGRAHALAQAKAGADIIAIDIADDVNGISYGMGTNEDLMETGRLVEMLGQKILLAQADVRSQSQMDAVVARGLEEFGQIDIVVANAGVWALSRVWETSEDDWLTMMDINLNGVWRTVKAVAPHMIERRSGSMVLTSSVNGVEPGAGYAHYTASKHGVIGLMKTVALELAPFGIRCNAILPGSIDTAMTDWPGAYDLFAGKDGGTREDRNAGGHAFHALDGCGPISPVAIAEAALWLTSDQASTVTGVSLPVEGGHLLMPGFGGSAPSVLGS